MTCKDCYHYDLCKSYIDDYSDDFIKQCEKNYEKYPPAEKMCEWFKDRSKFIELPCEIGDIVYITGEKYPCEITEVVIDECGIHFNWISYKKSYDLTEFWHDGDFSVDDINKTVFLTFKEAEKALEKYKK